LIKRIFWSEKFVDLQDKTKTNLIGVSLDNTTQQDFKNLVQILGRDPRVKASYNIDLSEVTQFICTQLKIPLTSKVKIEYEYDTERLLSIAKIDDSQEIAPPPFSIMYIEVLSETANDSNSSLKLVVTTDEQATTIVINGLSDPVFVSYISQNDPDIILFDGDYNLLDSHNVKSLSEILKRKVIIFNRNSIYDIHLLELVEKARFSYLPLKLASRYGMIRLIDSRITYELLKREFVIPTRMKTISKHHEQIRTLENIVEMDKAGMIVSPEVGIHENVAVLDFNDEYANLVLRHNISYETLTNNPDTRRTSTDDQMGLLPEIMNEIVARRMYLKKQLKEKLEPNSLLYNDCEIRLEVLKQILVCLYGTSGSIWNRYSNVGVFEEINKFSRQILLKTKDIVQNAGFDLIYADTDAVFLKRKNATKMD
jgi:hypothetical protein